MTDQEAAKTFHAMADTLHVAIHAAGTKGIPSGHLYAIVMGKLSLDLYNMLIECLIQTKCIKRTNHLLVSVKDPK